MSGQLRLGLEGGYWTVSRDGDADCRVIFDGHYSRHRYADGRKPKLFVGPGSKYVLVTPNLNALFVWRKLRSRDGQRGINCAIFRNESGILSSLMILEAERFAWAKWRRAKRLYTYVDASKTRHKRDPGRCFRKAGWKALKRRTKRNKLVILYKLKGWSAPMSTAAPRITNTDGIGRRMKLESELAAIKEMSRG